MMRITRILPILILALLVVPASAIVITAEPVGGNLKTLSAQGVTSYSYDSSPEDRGIQRIGIDIPTGTNVSFTLTYGDGSTVSGIYNYYNDGFYRQTSDIGLGSVTSTYTYTGLEQVGRVYVTGYAKNETMPGIWQSGFVIYGSTAGLSTITNDYVFYPITGDPVIYKFTMISSKPITGLSIFTNPRSEVAIAASKSLLDVANEWAEFATGMASTIIRVASDTLYWLKFIFIDNLTLTITLYIAVTMAFAARSCRGNPIKMGKTFIRDQKNLFEFILGLWNTLISLIASFRGIFRI